MAACLQPHGRPGGGSGKVKVVESCRLSLTVDKLPWQPKNRSSEVAEDAATAGLHPK